MTWWTVSFYVKSSFFRFVDFICDIVRDQYQAKHFLRKMSTSTPHSKTNIVKLNNPPSSSSSTTRDNNGADGVSSIRERERKKNEKERVLLKMSSITSFDNVFFSRWCNLEHDQSLFFYAYMYRPCHLFVDSYFSLFFMQCEIFCWSMVEVFLLPKWVPCEDEDMESTVFVVHRLTI